MSDLVDQITKMLLEEERKELLKTCLSADNLESEPSHAQSFIFKGICGKSHYRFTQGGNQCIAAYGKVSMADGTTKYIEDIKVGDRVLTFDTALKRLVPTTVVKHWYNGKKVINHYYLDEGILPCTRNHTVLQFNGSKVAIEDCNYVVNAAYQVLSILDIAGMVEPEDVYDITVDHPDHNYICNGVIVGNSGKTSCAIRDLTWMIQDIHPYWEKPTRDRCNNKLCGNTKVIRQDTHPSIYRYYCPKCENTWEAWDAEEPMTFLLVGENNKNIYLNLWLPRIKPLLLEPDQWHEVKVGPYVGWVEHKVKGHKIIFYPHGHGGERVRKSVQGFSIHAVYLDELAPLKVIEELQRRVDAKMGYFLAAFTMKTIDAEVARYLKSVEELGGAQVFRISKFDNPKYAGMRDEVMRQIAALPKSEQDKILYGTIEDVDDLVFKCTQEELEVNELPRNYSPKWRHVEVVDPAQQSTAGYSQFTQDPDTKIWYMIRSEYIKGMQDPLDLVDECITRSLNVNIVKRVSDNMAWFTSIASKRRDIHYSTPPSKQIQDGKIYTIKKAQTFLSSGRFKVLSSCSIFFDELSTYRWKEGSRSEIIHASKYHVLDTFRYFVDCLPKDEADEPQELTWMEEIRLYNEQLASKGLQGRVRSPTILSGGKAKKFINKLTKRGKRI